MLEEFKTLPDKNVRREKSLHVAASFPVSDKNIHVKLYIAPDKMSSQQKF